MSLYLQFWHNLYKPSTNQTNSVLAQMKLNYYLWKKLEFQSWNPESSEHNCSPLVSETIKLFWIFQFVELFQWNTNVTFQRAEAKEPLYYSGIKIWTLVSKPNCNMYAISSPCKNIPEISGGKYYFLSYTAKDKDTPWWDQFSDM